MSGREITADRRAWLVGELSAWEGLGLVGGDQAKRILGLYEGGTPEVESARRTDRASAAVMGLGGLLIGLAMFTAVAFNWNELHAWTRMALIFVVQGATYWGAWTIRRRGFVSGTNVVCFLGCLFYGAAIWLIAQTFNFNVEGVEGFWWWGVGVLPFALAVGSWPLHALAASTLAYYAATAIFGPLVSDFRSWRSFVEPAWSIPALAAVGMAWAYMKRSRAVLALYVALATVWLLGAPTAWKLDPAPIFWAGLVGSLLILIAECHAPETRLGIPYRFFGVVLVGGLLLPLSTYAANDAMQGELATTATATAIESAVAVVLAVVLFFVAANRDGRRGGSLASGVLASPGRWFPLAMIGLFAGMGLWTASGGGPLPTTIAANAAMAGLAIWLTVVGAREDRGRPFAAGVAYFLLWSVCRYVDLFSGFGGMPGAALMFLACGAALVAAAVIWRRLKEVHHVAHA